MQGGQNCLQVICEAGPAIKQVVSRVDGGNTVSKLLIYTNVQSDFGDVTLANEEALEQSSLVIHQVKRESSPKMMSWVGLLKTLLRTKLTKKVLKLALGLFFLDISASSLLQRC